MDNLIQLDHTIFHLINQTWTTWWLDDTMPWWTDMHKTAFFQFAIVPILLGWVYVQRKWMGFLFLAFACLAVGIMDGIQGKIIKKIFQRNRPPLSNLPFEVMVRAPHFGGYSFPSNHSANMFCFATFVGCYYPRLRLPLYLVACITAYSRMYCGVHFPSDVLGGALMGILVGWLLALAFRPLWERLQKHETARGLS